MRVMARRGIGSTSACAKTIHDDQSGHMTRAVGKVRILIVVMVPALTWAGRLHTSFAQEAPDRADAVTLEAGAPNDKVVIRLEGIRARAPDDTCKTKKGKTWPCGAKAKAALMQLIRSRAVTCSVPQGGEINDFAARCSVMDQDLSSWLVRRGWATPEDGAQEFAKALEAAKTEKLGLWQAE